MLWDVHNICGSLRLQIVRSYRFKALAKPKHILSNKKRLEILNELGMRLFAFLHC